MKTCEKLLVMRKSTFSERHSKSKNHASTGNCLNKGNSGSFRNAQYAHKYPHHVDHFVLDAIAPHGYVSFDIAEIQLEAIIDARSASCRTSTR
jgi:hypothetical protein